MIPPMSGRGVDAKVRTLEEAVAIDVDDLGDRLFPRRHEQNARRSRFLRHHPPTGEWSRQPERDRVQRQPVERHRAEQPEQRVTRQRTGVDGLQEHEIGDPVGATPAKIVVAAKPESFVDAPLASEHRMTFARAAERGCAFGNIVVDGNDLPASEIPHAFLVEGHEHDAVAIQNAQVIVEGRDHEIAVVDATHVRARHRTDGCSRGALVVNEEAAHVLHIGVMARAPDGPRRSFSLSFACLL